MRDPSGNLIQHLSHLTTAFLSIKIQFRFIARHPEHIHYSESFGELIAKVCCNNSKSIKMTTNKIEIAQKDYF
jgi:hypothetical protein